MARRPAKKPLLNMYHKTRRLEWPRRHQNRQLRHWRHVLFSDESMFLLHRADERVRIRRRVGKRFQEDFVVGTVAHGGGSVHVWGEIHNGNRSNLGLPAEQFSTATPTGGFWRQKWCHMFGHTLAVISCSNTTMPIPTELEGYRISWKGRKLTNWTLYHIPQI